MVVQSRKRKRKRSRKTTSKAATPSASSVAAIQWAAHEAFVFCREHRHSLSSQWVTSHIERILYRVFRQLVEQVEDREAAVTKYRLDLTAARKKHKVLLNEIEFRDRLIGSLQAKISSLEGRDGPE